MHILFVVGKFPDLSFILRTTQTLAMRGHQVTVAARSRGDWFVFNNDLPLPKTLNVTYLLPDNGLADPRRAMLLVLGLLSLVARAPAPALRLMRYCLTHPSTRKSVLLNFVRYLPYMGLRPDIIQFDFPMTASIYGQLADLLRVPTVVSCRGSDIHMLEQRSPVERGRRIDSICSATAVHCVSEELAHEVTRITGRTQGIWINRPAVPAERIPYKVSYETSNAPLIITVGRLTWIKGYDYLLAALARLKQHNVQFQAQLIGGGELYSVLRFSIDDLGLTDSVQLVGELASAEVLRRLPDADVFVLSSHQEGISNSALEAMAAGLPVLTTRAGGMPEVIRDGIDGFIVPVRDIGAMAEQLKCLLADASLRERMGKSARERVASDFTMARQVRVFEQLYQSIAGDKKQ